MNAQPEYLSPKQARARLNVSRTVFDSRYRPQLTEYRHGPRTVRFSSLELETMLAETVAPKEEEAAMFGRRTVEDALEAAWRAKWRQAKGARKKAQLMKVVKRECGKVRLGDVDYEWLESYVGELTERDLAPATIRSRVSMIRHAFGMCVRRGWMKAVPECPPIEAPKGKLRWLTDAEAKRLLESCDSQRYQIAEVMRDVIAFLLDTGARLGELIKVREERLYLRGTMTYVEFLDRKAGDDLRVPLTNAARKAIYRLLANKYWMARVRGACESAKRCNSAQNWLTHRFGEIRDHAKLPDVTAHTLRHTFASRLVQRGVDIYKVQKLLGHSNIKMTERYSHLAPSSLDSAITVLEPVDPKVSKLSDYRKD